MSNSLDPDQDRHYVWVHSVCQGYLQKTLAGKEFIQLPILGILLFSQGPKFRPHSKWNLGVLKKNLNLTKKNVVFFEDWDFHSVNTYTIATR